MVYILQNRINIYQLMNGNSLFLHFQKNEKNIKASLDKCRLKDMLTFQDILCMGHFYHLQFLHSN